MQLTTEIAAMNTSDQQTLHPVWLRNFIDFYQSLGVDDLSGMAEVYHQNVTFEDPLHVINGLNGLVQYFETLYKNITQCTFVVEQALHDGDQASVYWSMTYCHKYLNGGDTIVVAGSSLIIGKQDKIIYHRDYIDLGQMLYENIPVLGSIIRWLKKQVSK